MASQDFGWIKHALQVARQNGIVEIELLNEDLSFSARLSAKPTAARPLSSVSAVVESPREDFKPINANIVGIYQPGDVELAVGSRVKVGDVVAKLEALGISSPLESKVQGEIVEVLISPGEAVEYGQPLANVKVGS